MWAAPLWYKRNWKKKPFPFIPQRRILALFLVLSLLLNILRFIFNVVFCNCALCGCFGKAEVSRLLFFLNSTRPNHDLGCVSASARLTPLRVCPGCTTRQVRSEAATQEAGFAAPPRCSKPVQLKSAYLHQHEARDRQDLALEVCLEAVMAIKYS